jgi:uncharacterized protein
MLSDEQRRQLLAIARSAVTARVVGSRVASPPSVEFPEASGVFVTVNVDRQLRGCLGTLDRVRDLPSDVARCAANAASEDPRFPAITAGELPRLTIDVSVLGPLERIDPQEHSAIAIGEHGLVVEHGERRGLLLPQVATEWGWSRERFLCQTCVKAGLPPDAWRQDAIVYRFAAEVFGE